ncbi:MAG: hypothetical protein M1819_001853 [Sarea resinae]|nr:MAG: hypothetical protein M1819_001853 [Sarea resinae]
MAANLPAKLKTADLSRFAHRAAQVEKAKPEVAYWCNYWIVNQILSKGLHSADDECMSYTMNLMDKLEKTKAEYADNDTITDDVAGRAYIEQFGLQTFQRADNAVRANKASRQTADTFQAAATFLDLGHIWGELDPEVASKVKYAKFHALRIAKAIKAGEDPNLSNPSPEPSPSQEEPPLDPNDPEVQLINGTSTDFSATDKPRQPSIQEIPDEQDRLEPRLAAQSALDESLHPSRASSIPRQPASQSPPLPPQSAVDLPDPDSQPPEFVGYFPKVPTNESEPSAPILPTAPADESETLGLSQPSLPSFIDHDPVSGGLPATSDHPIATSPDVVRRLAPPAQLDSPEEHDYYRQPTTNSQPSSLLPPVKDAEKYVSDEEAIVSAQKHARWAISALNFEDVNTAVKELRIALDSLGARP